MPPRKTTATKPSPAEAAAKEALNDGDMQLEFRGEKFVIKADARQSARFAMAVASGSEPQMIWELIDAGDQPRFLTLAKRGESFADFAVDFFESYGKASGQGNS